MRESLKKSLEDSPAKGFERYPAGSIVICNACAMPIFKLEYGIDLGAGSGRSAKAFKPLSLADLDALTVRTVVDAGLRAKIMGMSAEQRTDHIAKLREVRAGDPMLCPCCEMCFVQVLSVTQHEVLDKAYTIEMLTVPPDGKPSPLRGKHLGATKDWVH